MAHDVFISHANEDRGSAEAVCHKLEAEGYSCWLAPRDVPPGQDSAAPIVQAIEEARVTVFVFSEKSNDSPFVHNEIWTSFRKGVPIIPFRIENVLPCAKLRLYLGPVQWLDALTLPVEQHFDKLIEALDPFIPEPEPSTPAESIETPSSYEAVFRSVIRVLTQQGGHIGPRDPRGSDWPRRVIPQGDAGTIERLWRLHGWNVAVLAVVIVCAIGLLCVAYFLPRMQCQISNIGVSIRDDENGRLAIRALELYRQRFPKMSPKFSNREIRLIRGSPEDHRDNKVLGVIGQLTSDYADLECKEYERIRIVYISPGATNPNVTSGKKYVFSMNLNDTMQGRMIATFLKYVRRCKSVAVVYIEDPYTTALKDGFVPELFPSLHWIPLVNRRNFPTDFVVERLKPLWNEEKPVDAIVLLMFSQEAASITKGKRSPGE